MASAEKLNKIATDLVLEEVVRDKLKIQRRQDQQRQQQEHPTTSVQDDASTDNTESSGFDDLSHWRERRMQQFKQQKLRKQELLNLGHGTYEEVVQDDFLGVVTKAPRAVCHFYSPTFERCRIIDRHLNILAAKHPETRFFKMAAEKAPFFSAKLHIRTLPSLVLFIDGVAIKTLVGFTPFGNKDDFTTSAVARVLLREKIIDNTLNQISSGSDESDLAE